MTWSVGSYSAYLPQMGSLPAFSYIPVYHPEEIMKAWNTWQMTNNFDDFRAAISHEEMELSLHHEGGYAQLLSGYTSDLMTNAEALMKLFDLPPMSFNTPYDPDDIKYNFWTSHYDLLTKMFLDYQSDPNAFVQDVRALDDTIQGYKLDNWDDTDREMQECSDWQYALSNTDDPTTLLQLLGFQEQ